LLRFLPFAGSEEVEEEIWFGLDALTARQQRIPAAISEALQDDSPVRRALAGYMLARRGDREQRATAKKLLADSDPLVRLRTAQGLLGAKDKTAVPILIALLEDAPVLLAWQAEELLCYAAGEGAAPGVVVGLGSADARQKCREAWAAWWKTQGDQVDLRKRDEESRRPILLLLWGTGFNDPNNVWVSGCDGRVRWKLEMPGRSGKTEFSVMDVHLMMPAGRLLIAQFSYESSNQRPEDVAGITERGLDGEVFRRHRMNDAVQCRRLPNGNTWILSRRGEIQEVSPSGEIVSSQRMVGPNRKGRIEVLAAGSWLPSPALPLRNGHTLVTEQKNFPSPIREVEPGGKVLWENPWGSDIQKRLILDLVRLGFDVPRPKDFDLRTVPTRVRELSSKDPEVRWRSALALQQIGPSAREAIPHLTDALTDTEPRIRNVAEGALNVILTTQDFALVRKLAEDSRTPVRAGAMVFLWKFTDQAKEVVPLLREGLRDRDAEVRAKAVGRLSSFPSERKLFVPDLIESLKDTAVVGEARHGNTVACCAADALGWFQADARPAVPALTEAAKGGGRKLRSGAIRALASIALADRSCLRDVLLVLVEALRDKTTPALRLQAAQELGRLGPESKLAVEDLVSLFRDPELGPEYKKVAADSLGNIGLGAKVAIPVLREALQDQDYGVRTAVADALKKIQP
jgi:HEAT repeat protein